MNYVSAKEAKEFFKVTGATLYRWRQCGRIASRTITKRKILYDIDSVISIPSIKTRKNVIYARVSTTKQKSDLDAQIETIKTYMLSNGVICDEIYKDIASGMNDDRQSLNNLICAVTRNEVDTIYITFKDRLTRFGFGYIKYICSLFDTNIVVLDNNEETNKDFQKEMSDDLVSIIHHFSMKIYSNRRKRLKEIEKMLKEDK